MYDLDPVQHPSHVAVEPLALHPALVPLVSRWLFDEWGHLAPSATPEWVEERVRERLTTDRVPIIFVATESQGALRVPVGTASIKLRELAVRPSLVYWLGSVYTVPAARGRGVASLVCRFAAEWADAHGLPELFLYTSNAERLYERLGWEVIERTTFNDEPIAVMRRSAAHHDRREAS